MTIKLVHARNDGDLLPYKALRLGHAYRLERSPQGPNLGNIYIMGTDGLVNIQSGLPRLDDTHDGYREVDLEITVKNKE